MDTTANRGVLRPSGRILLVSCYELGHQPLGVALPLGFLKRAGFAADAVDIAVESLDEERIRHARFIGISVPMHTALRLGVRVAERVRELNPACKICFYGLYAALNHEYLLQHGGDYCIGGEYEGPLLELVEALDASEASDAEALEIPSVITRRHRQSPSLNHLPFVVPDRERLPPLEEYAHLISGGECHTAGYVEATRGCLHLCTHCPIPPVYGGRFFAIPQDVVLEDIRSQVRAGARHITFGDPDFLNGPTHAVRVVRAMHEEFPELTFDFTAKVEHLLSRGQHLPELADCGCLFIISAVESLSDRVLQILAKNHTRDEVEQALAVCRQAGIALRPTWVAFTPWTTRDDFREMLEFIETRDLIDHVDPVQYSIRLLIPPGSWIAELPETRPHLGELDEAAFTYRWEHPDPDMDRLHRQIAQVVERAARDGEKTRATFRRVQDLVDERSRPAPVWDDEHPEVPRLSESWFC